MSQIAVILMQPPYGSEQAREGLEFALASTNYGHECCVIFAGDGVYQLLGPQQPDKQKNHLKQLNLMALYDIDEVYVCTASLQALGLSHADLAFAAQPLAPSELRQRISLCQHTVTF